MQHYYCGSIITSKMAAARCQILRLKCNDLISADGAPPQTVMGEL